MTTRLKLNFSLGCISYGIFIANILNRNIEYSLLFNPDMTQIFQTQNFYVAVFTKCGTDTLL